MIGVIVVHFGSAETTYRCLASIIRDRSAPERQVVVVDNSDNLDLLALPADAIHLPCPENPGFGRGANLGALRLLANESLVGLVILNHDVVLEQGFLGAVLAALETDGVGAVGGPLYIDHVGGVLWSAGGSLNLITGTVRQSRSPRLAKKRRLVTFLPGAALAVRADAWREVGGFSPRYFLYNEDLDLCLRLREAGWRLAYEPAMAAVHLLGEATGSAEGSPLYLEHLTATRLQPFASPFYRLYLAIIHSAYVPCRAALLFLRLGLGAKSRARALFRGHARALRGLWNDTIGDP